MKRFPLEVVFKAIDKVTAPLKSIKGSVSQFQNSLNSVGKNFDKGMTRAAKVGLAAQAVGDLRDQTMSLLGPAINVGREFEKTMSQVAAVSRVKVGSEEFKKLEESARQFGATTSFSATQAAEGMTFLAMAGFDANKIIQAMPGMLNLAKAGNIDLAKAADIASNTLGAFKMEADQMPRVANAMAAAFTRSNVDMNMLADTFKYVAPIANTAGMSIEDLAAMTGLLGDIGLQGSQAGTALRAGLLRLSKLPKPAAQALGELNIVTMHTNESIAELSKQGIDTSKMKVGDLRQMSDILEEIRIKTQGMGSGQRLEFIGKVFGTEASGAFTELITKADESGKSIRKFSAEISKAAASNEVADIANTMGANFDGAMKTMDSAREELSLTVYDVIKPALTTLANIGSKAFRWVGNFAKENPVLTRTIVMVVGAVAALTAVLLPILGIIAGTIAAVTTIAAGWAAFTAAIAIAKTAFISFTATLLANPLTWIVIAVVAVIAAIWMLYKNWDQISAYLGNLWESIKTKFSEMTESIKLKLIAAWEWMKGLFASWEPTINGLIAGFLNIPNVIAGVWENLKTYFSGLWASVTGIFTSAISKISSMIPDFVKNFFSGKGGGNIKMGAAKPVGGAVAGGVTNTTTNRSVVDVNFGNVPSGTRFSNRKPTKGVNLSMGYNGAAF